MGEMGSPHMGKRVVGRFFCFFSKPLFLLTYLPKARSEENLLTAAAFAAKLQSQVDARLRREGGASGVDLLVAGCEVSLWVGEQFTADVHRVLPELRSVFVSHGPHFFHVSDTRFSVMSDIESIFSG